MSTKSDAQALVRDEQQARLLGILARRDGKPVTYGELREAGIEFPAGLVAELELAGVEIERGQMIVPGGRRVTALRLRPAPRERRGGHELSASAELSPASQLPAARQLSGARKLPAALERPATRQRSAPRQLPRPRPLPGRSQESASAGAGSRWRKRPLVSLALVGDAALIAAVVVAVLSSGGSPAKRASHRPTHVAASAAQRTRAHGVSSHRRTRPPSSPRSTHSSAQASASQATAPAVSSTTTTASQPVAPTPTTASPATTPTNASPATTTTASRTAPSSAAPTPTAQSLVQAFYEAAAQHRYAAAWALADANMRDELGGYAAFADQMSSVRKIVFHRIETVQSAPDAATFAVQTTSVLSNETQQCSGTVRTVNASGTWLVDGIAIQCT